MYRSGDATARAKERSLEWISLYDEPEPAPPIEGLVYATRPTVTTATNGRRYFLKGPEPIVVVTELLAYGLADIVGVSVPRHALCRHPVTNNVLFASEAASINSGVDRLLDPRYATNPELLADVIAFDTWIGNWDRNAGSIVAEVESGHKEARVKIFAIDFEKAEVLRGRSIIEVTTFDPGRWWPNGDLADICSGLSLPNAQIGRINQVEAQQVEIVLTAAATALGEKVDRSEAIQHQLMSRAARIEVLTTEVWND